MDAITSCFIGSKGANKALRFLLVTMWIVTGLMMVAAPGLAQETERHDAKLEICKIDFPNDPTNVKLRATVTWGDSAARGNAIVTYYIGALNPNGELWPQVISGRIARRHGGAKRETPIQRAQVEFVVSQQSTFPTSLAVFGLEEEAQNVYAAACNSGSCYLHMPRTGVHELSEEVEMGSFHEAFALCER